jgi:hypothetical protein
MGISYRRYEILIPSRFNDGREIPEALFVETLFALRNRFGAVSSETQVIEVSGRTLGLFIATRISEFSLMFRIRQSTASSSCSSSQC